MQQSLLFGGLLSCLLSSACSGVVTNPASSDCQQDADCTGVNQSCVGGTCRTSSSSTECTDDDQCSDPTVCHGAQEAICQDGRCYYEALVDGTPCTRSSDDGEAQGVCSAGHCVECAVASHCTEPPTSYTMCFVAECLNGACDYAPQPNNVCVEAGCQDGVISEERICGEHGTCPLLGTEVSCGGYACDGTACKTTCEGHGDCLNTHYCDAVAGCVPKLGNGEDCEADGAPACESGFCDFDSGLCCNSGHCCHGPADCPASYSSPATCADETESTECQGTRLDTTCIDFTCGSLTVDDDSGCDGFARECPDNFAPIQCSDEADQAVAVCPSDCNVGACIEGYDCVGGHCALSAGVGAPCNESLPCGAGLKCENGICCSETGGTCCTAENQGTVCGGGLSCNVPAASCFQSCTNYSQSRCQSAGDYCWANICIAKAENGTSCSHFNQCISTYCEDDTCCNAACNQVCQSCASGTCTTVSSAPDPGTCDGSGLGCDGSACSCDIAGSCKRAVGQPCTEADQCASANCQCGVDDCSFKICSEPEVDCAVCWYTSDGTACDASGMMEHCGECRWCDGFGSCVPIPAEDMSCTSCDGASCTCDEFGECKRARGELCTSGGQCASGNCQCHNADCTQSICSDAELDCPACAYTADGVTCELGDCDCTLPWGGTLAHGASVTAYESSSVPCAQSCSSETRECASGVLSGSFVYQNCLQPAAGSVCSDGSLYVGVYDSHHYYTPAVDQGTMSWNYGGFDEADWSVTGATSTTDGAANTAILVTLEDAGAPYLAALACGNLTAHGRDDWFLPARFELNLLHLDYEDIGGFNHDYYWSSSETAAISAWWRQMSTGSESQSMPKSADTLAVRCMRKD